MVYDSGPILFFCIWLTTFTKTNYDETVLFSLYILGSFIITDIFFNCENSCNVFALEFLNAINFSWLEISLQNRLGCLIRNEHCIYWHSVLILLLLAVKYMDF